MLIWFAVTAPVIVAEVFRSPMVDYRLVVVGALLPLVEVVARTPAVLHTLVGSAVALFLVVVVTVNRRLLRRRLLGIPIGMFLHLVLDGTWLRAELFWWPAFGLELDPELLGEVGRSVGFVAAAELAGLAVGGWAWRRYGLSSADNRSLLLRRGHLAREVLT